MWRTWDRQTADSIRATTLITLLWLKGVACWPDGTYGIPMSKTGCPEVTDFTWKQGSRTHHTEKGSHASEGSHLAGIYTYPSDRVTQSFCMKTTYAGDGIHTWQKGRYCMFKSGDCPRGFREGWLYWDDAAPWFGDTIQNQSGVLPEGEYDRNTKIRFCCRNDGNAGDPIVLPINSPFHLLMWGDRCQEVRGMTTSEEFVYWKDEHSLNMNTQGGLYPRVLRSKYPNKYTKVFYCYYTRAPANKNVATLFTVLYVIAGVIGAVVVILVLICIVQRIAGRKSKDHYDDTNITNTARERMLTQRDAERDELRRTIPEPIVEYRPPEYSEGEDGSVAIYNEKKRRPTPGSVNGAAGGAGVAAAGGDGASGSTAPMESPTDEAAGSFSSAEDHTPMLQPPPFDNMSPPPPFDGGLVVPRYPDGTGAVSLPPRPITQPPSYEDVLREDGKLHSIS